MASSEFSRLSGFLSALRAKTDFVPQVALVLGSGLGAFAETHVDIACTVPYSEIPGFPVSTVPGHTGRFVFGRIQGLPVVVMQGRVHYYEGYAMRDVVAGVRLMHMLGADKLFLTNASGGINPSFYPGAFMLITGQISSFIPSPLIGENVEELGTRFPDMSAIYSPRLQKIVRDVAAAQGTPLFSGTYLQVGGPNFESPNEIEMFRLLGADACGMSTAVEAIAARHMGMEVCGISCVSNLAAGMSKTPLTHEEVQETADRVSRQFAALVSGSIAAMGTSGS